jgi:hypothetical protein
VPLLDALTIVLALTGGITLALWAAYGLFTLVLRLMGQDTND